MKAPKLWFKNIFNSKTTYKSRTTRIGMHAEEHARRWLIKQGFRIIQCNYRCQYGEIDLIAQHQCELVFVEVRYRNGKEGFGDAAESVNERKQRKIKRTAANFLMRHPHYHDWPCRFDVLAFNEGDEPEQIIAAFD